MSLDWSIEQCVKSDDLIEDKAWELTQAVIWSCMGVHLSGITLENAKEFHARNEILGKRSILPDSLTLAEIERYVGLTTNVSNKTREQFLNAWNIDEKGAKWVS